MQNRNWGSRLTRGQVRQVLKWKIVYKMVLCWACLICVEIWVGNELIHADELKLVGEKCQDCHSLKRVFKAQYDSVGWNEALDRMLEEGADFTENERQEIVSFLLDQDDEKSAWQTLGLLHFVLNHFPIVLIWIVAFFDGRAWWRKERLAGLWNHLLLRLAVPAMAVVIFCGLALVNELSTISPQLVEHRNIGFIAGVLVLVIWLLRERANRCQDQWSLILYRFFLGLCVLVTSIAADRGGVLVHGDLIGYFMAAFNRS